MSMRDLGEEIAAEFAEESGNGHQAAGGSNGKNPWQPWVENDQLGWSDLDEAGAGGAEYESWMNLMWSGVVTRLSTLWDYLSDAFLPRETQQEYFRHGQALAQFQLTARACNRQGMIDELQASVETLTNEIETLREEYGGYHDLDEYEEDKEEEVETPAEILDVYARIGEMETVIDQSRKTIAELRRKTSWARAKGVYYDTKPLFEELSKPNPSPSRVAGLCPGIWNRLFAYAKLTAQGTGQLHREAMLARTLHTNPDVGVGTTLERMRRRGQSMRDKEE